VNPLRRLAIAWRALGNAVATAIDDEAQRQALPGVSFASGAIVRGADRISTGKGVFIDHCAYLNPSTVNDRRGYIRLGDAVEIGPYCVLWGGGGIDIGSNVHLGAHVHITSQQGRPVPPEQTDPQVALAIDCAPVRIEDHVLIYSGTIVVPGVTIGHHSTVAAGSVVIEDVPPYSMAAGAPARIVRRGAA
jgi:acetyltransferase-like isoleucine patch superfamily enzyme